MPNWNQRDARVPTDTVTKRPTFEVFVEPDREAPILAYCQTFALVERPHLTVRRGDPLSLLYQRSDGTRQEIMRVYCRAVVSVTITTTQIVVADTRLPPIAAQVFYEALGFPNEDSLHARYNPYHRSQPVTIVHWA